MIVSFAPCCFVFFFFLKCFVSKTHRVLWMMQPEKKPKGWVGKCNNVWCRQRDEKGDVTEERRMAGDTWIKTRSERILRQRQTNTQHEHTHSQWPPSNCRTLDTNTHSCQGQTKIIHKTPTPPPLGVTDTVSPSCTHTRMELPGGSMLSMWPVENHYSAVQTKEPRVNFLLNAQASSSPWHQPPQKGVPTVAGSCSVCFLRNAYCAVWTGTIQKVLSMLSQNCISPSSNCVQVDTPWTFQWGNTHPSKKV